MYDWSTFDDKSAQADEVIKPGAVIITEDYKLTMIEEVCPYLGANWVNKPEHRRVRCANGQWYTVTPSHIVGR